MNIKIMLIRITLPMPLNGYIFCSGEYSSYYNDSKFPSLARNWDPSTTSQLTVFTDSAASGGTEKTFATHTGGTVQSWYLPSGNNIYPIRGLTSASPMRNHADFINFYMYWKGA